MDWIYTYNTYISKIIVTVTRTVYTHYVWVNTHRHSALIVAKFCVCRHKMNEDGSRNRKSFPDGVPITNHSKMPAVLCVQSLLSAWLATVSFFAENSREYPRGGISSHWLEKCHRRHERQAGVLVIRAISTHISKLCTVYHVHCMHLVVSLTKSTFSTCTKRCGMKKS